MNINEIIVTRGIERILHFTTSDGFLGTLATTPNALLPRAMLENNALLEFILKLNAPTRTDTDWFSYNSLSITDINPSFFKYSKQIHNGATWIILEFSPDILNHEGVIFTTTNNIYTECVRIGGSEGFEMLFADRIKNNHVRGGFISRFSSKQPNQPTDNQAEALYLGALSCEFLKKVHVVNHDALALVTAQMKACRCEYNIVISPELFLQ